MCLGTPLLVFKSFQPPPQKKNGCSQFTFSILFDVSKCLSPGTQAWNTVYSFLKSHPHSSPLTSSSLFHSPHFPGLYILLIPLLIFLINRPIPQPLRSSLACNMIHYPSPRKFFKLQPVIAPVVNVRWDFIFNSPDLSSIWFIFFSPKVS